MTISSSQVPAADGPNHLTPSDVVAGQWMDALLDPNFQPAQAAPKKRPRTSAARRRSALRGKLVANPNRQDGSPPFALVDQHGGVLRYVEPVDSINLKAHLGQTVTVRRDTGDTLLASQLNLSPAGPSQRSSAKNAGVQLVQNLEPIPAGDPIPDAADATPVHRKGQAIESYDEGPVYFEGDDNFNGGFNEGLNFGGCPNCGDVTCGGHVGGGCGSRGRFYAHAEYLHWWFKGMETPPLVIQFEDLDLGSGAAIGPISTIYGGTPVLEDGRSGGRITLGLWLDDYGQWALEGDYLRFNDVEERFAAGLKDGLVPDNGSFIGRPFFNTGVIGGDPTTIGPSQEDVDTNRLDGRVTVLVQSEFQTGGIRLRHNLCCRPGCGVGCGDSVGCGYGVGCGSGVDPSDGLLHGLLTLMTKGTRHHDVLYGVRWASLNESLRVDEDLQEFTSLSTNPPTLGNEIDVFDEFSAENEFFGGEIGYETQWQHGRWSLNLLRKLAIGNTRQLVQINGATTIDDGLGAVDTTPGGLLTQSYDHSDGFTVGNIGTYERDEFSVLPEVGVTLGYHLTPRVKLTGGYTLLYWSNVLRPGEQIDIDVNGNLLNRNGVPDEAAIVPGDHPRFAFRQDDLWMHGFNLGAECSW